MNDESQTMEDGVVEIIDDVDKEVSELEKKYDGLKSKIGRYANENTELVFKVIHPTETYCKQQEEMGIYNGWGSVFTMLENYLETLTK